LKPTHGTVILSPALQGEGPFSFALEMKRAVGGWFARHAALPQKAQSRLVSYEQ
jgi:hypothetical protein